MIVRDAIWTGMLAMNETLEMMREPAGGCLRRPKMPIIQRPFRQRISYRPYTLPDDAERVNGIWYSRSEDERNLAWIKSQDPRNGYRF